MVHNTLEEHFIKNFTDLMEFVVVVQNPHGEFDFNYTQVIKVPFAKFEIFEVKSANELVPIIDFDILKPFRF